MTRRFAMAFAATVLAAILAAAGDPPPMPQLIVKARYVWVTTLQGETQGAGRPRVLEDDRAAGNLERKIREWGRYKVTMRPEDADIILVVRVGRRASVTAGSTTIPSPGGTLGVEAGPVQDLLEIHRGGRDPQQSTPLWRELMKDGLRTPEMPLFELFKEEVLEAEQAARARR